MLEELTGRARVVGFKQSRRAIAQGLAARVYLACDADPALTERVDALCAAVPVEKDATMAQLGAAAGIAVGAAVVTLLNG